MILEQDRLKKLTQPVVIVAGASGQLAKAFIRVLEHNQQPYVALDKSVGLTTENYCLASEKIDFLDESKVAKLFQHLFDSYNVQYLVNCVGRIHNGLAVNLQGQDLSAAEFKSVVDDNLITSFNIGKLFIKNCLEKGKPGSLVLLSSVNSIGGKYGQAAYASSKSSVESLMRTWVKEYSKFGLRFNVVSPGYIETSSMRANMSEDAVARVIQEIPLGRLGQAHEVSAAIEFLLKNEYVNGAIIRIDGGLRT